MNPPIEFEAKTDRELLIQVVVTTNNINERLVDINNVVKNHEERINTLEKQPPATFNKKGGAITAGVALGIIAFFTWLFNKLGVG